MSQLMDRAMENRSGLAAGGATGLAAEAATGLALELAATGLAAEPDPAVALAASPPKTFRPLVFGETLFDHFPDGTRAMGGAPFNVAWHLHGFKSVPLLVTSIGKDPAGREALDRMGEWGMDSRGVQVHPDRPTGRVSVEIENGEALFLIEARQAYDEIDAKRLPHAAVLADVDLLYHGTLALREAVSREALSRLRESAQAPVLVDVNLRNPWWTQDAVAWALEEPNGPR